MNVRRMALVWAIVAIAITAGVIGSRPTLPVEAAPPSATPGALHVASGGRHTCAITSAGGVQCWGDNGFGQLGDGTTALHATPVEVSGLNSGVVAIAAGATHACALTSAGGVKCWGRNDHGQLGDGTTTDRAAPVDVSGLSGGVMAITAGGSHTCALTLSSGAKCWGANDYGQLGETATGDQWTPVDVIGLTSGAAAIAAGGAHTCALTGVGGVKCWGANHYGQVGDGTTTDRDEPVDVVGLRDGVAAVATGDQHTCALMASGGVQCWGWNGYGQVGDGVTVNWATTPVDVVGLSSGVPAVAAGGNHTCALLAGGSVKCWGDNRFGQVGDGTWTNRITAVDVAGPGGIAAIAAGRSHTCAVTNAGGVKCWGKNDYGQLGAGTADYRRARPTDVVGLSSGVAAVVAGAAHTCALTTAGGVKCWGLNLDGELGDGTRTFLRPTPTDVVGLSSGVSAIAAGGQHTCALTSAGGVKCWGYNYTGQLGDGTRMNSSFTPVDVVGLSSGVTAIAAGDSHACALTNAGTVKCWGFNSSHQLGPGATDVYITTPVDVPGLSGVTAIAAGNGHTCALASGGVKCWGWNRYGQLGDGTTNDSAAPLTVSGLNSGVAAIAAGWGHTCAVTSGGAVKCWGKNDLGQLGDGTTTDRSAPVDVSGLSGATAVSAGEWHTCALASGTVKCWGDNRAGQLGDGTTTSRVTPGDVVGLSGVTAISLGSGHTCAVTSAGAARCWGANGYGQVGDGTTGASQSRPTYVSGLSSGLVALAAGGAHTCVLTGAGGVKCWGANGAGGLGNGTTADSLSPVDVVGLSSGVTAISAGTGHTCALTSGGGVKCWGNNQFGQVGDGTQVDRLTPVDVSGLGSGVVAVAAGGTHTCALTGVGAVKCWGLNEDGQVGAGTSGGVSPTPVAVAPLGSGVAAIAAGQFHTCALTSAGGVKCWGANYDGQLGTGASGGTQPTPVDVVGLTSGVTGLAGGGWHTCALTSAGGLKCWGENYYGQLGNGTSINLNATPGDVSGLTSGVAAVTTGGDHTCALTSAGGVKCWGRNDHGQLGDTTSDNRSAPVAVFGLDAGMAALATGWRHNCALTNTGGVKCWGANSVGQLGDGTTTDAATPLAALRLGPQVATGNAQVAGSTATLTGLGRPLGSATTYFFEYGTSSAYGQIAPAQVQGAGDAESVAARLNGLPLGFTYHYRLVAVNSDGIALGAERTFATLAPRTYILALPYIAREVTVFVVPLRASYLAAGGGQTCAVTQAGVKCWGDNRDGQLGNGTTVDMSTTPVDVVGLGSDVTAIAGGGNHTCILTRLGGVKCWGFNGFGQLGDGTTTNRNTPVDVVGLTNGVAAIAPGSAQTCALLRGGRVMCWGNNDTGQLGDGTTTNRSTPVDVVGLARDVTAIAAGRDHACALTATGAVKCWGANTYGQLGDGTTRGSLSPVNVVGLASGAAAIVAGDHYSCALTSAGGVKCWGYNDWGSLGDGTTTNRWTPVDVVGLSSGVVSLAAGGLHACALTTASGMKCWGHGYFGQLGIGSRGGSGTPVDVRGLSIGVAAISTGTVHTCAVTGAGWVKCWGYNSSGQVGDGTQEERWAPVAVVGLSSGVGPPLPGGARLR